MSNLSDRTQFLLLAALGAPDAVADLISDIENISTSEIADLAVTTAKLAASAVTDAKVATGIDAAKIGSGVVSNAEFAFVDGVTSAIQTQLNAKLASASFTDAAVSGKLITGFVSGAGTVAAADSILGAVNKLDGNQVAFASSYNENLSISATFDHSIGAKTCKVDKNQNACTLFVPSMSWADGLGTAVACAAATLPGAFRPAVDTKIPICCIDNATASFGNVVVGADGSVTLYLSAGTTGFTNAQAGSSSAMNVTYFLV